MVLMSIPYIEFVYIGYFKLENFAIQNVYCREINYTTFYFTLIMNPSTLSYDFRPILYPYNYPNFVPVLVQPQPTFRLVFNHIIQNSCVYRNPDSNIMYYLYQNIDMISLTPIQYTSHIKPT